MDFTIEGRCNKCGQLIAVRDVRLNANGTIVVWTDICEDCLQDEYKGAYSEGFNDGRDEGYDDGYNDAMSEKGD